MGCAFNHAVLDGTSTWHFMSSWAEICKKPGLSEARTGSPPPSVPPAASNRVAQLTEKIFKFSEAAIVQIESDTRSDGTNPFSTFEALSAHVWRHVTRARNLQSEEETLFAVFLDCRTLVDPPMKVTFFGNLTQAIFTVKKAGWLSEHQPQSVASLIQTDIKKHNSKAIDEREKVWEKSQSKDLGKNCVVVESSLSFKVYEVDFGWGEPENVRSGSNNKFDGMIHLYPGKSGGRSIDVELTLEPEAMGRLEKDNEFLFPKKKKR